MSRVNQPQGADPGTEGRKEKETEENKLPRPKDGAAQKERKG